MVTNNNNIQELFPAFNKQLIEVSSPNFSKEKHNYILDILTDETIHQNVFQATPFGFTFPAIFGGVGTSVYTVGDYVFVNVVSGAFNYSGVHRVVYVPNDSAIVIDTDYLGDIVGGEIQVFRIFRNKLPASPDQTAIFDVNGYSTGRISEDFALNNVGIFNVPKSFDRFQFLASEEYYQNSTTGSITDNNGLIQVNDVQGGDIELGQFVQYVNDTFSQTVYNGIFEVVQIEDTGTQINITLNKSFIIPVLSTGQFILLPKRVTVYSDVNQISDPNILFNGALKYPDILNFDPVEFDMSQYNFGRFLNTAPDVNKIKFGQRSYTQFYQSNNTTATQFIVQVIDENGVPHDYIINSGASPDNFLGIAVGTFDLNEIDPSLFEIIAPRGLPIIQECDRSYCVRLYGSDECDINGIQTSNFQHPYFQVLNPNTWSTTNADTMTVTVLASEINGIPQTITPSGNTYNQATVTGQTSEEIYSNEIAIQTGFNVQSSDAFGSGMINGHWIEVDHDVDFYLKVRLRLSGLLFQSGISIDVEYRWNSATCETTYQLTNGLAQYVSASGTKFEKSRTRPLLVRRLRGWVGIQSNPVALANISEQICFELDRTPWGYRGVRLLFQDRLGSFVGFNFNQKTIRTVETSSDGFEVDRYQVGSLDTTSRGFKTIQFSYSEEWELNSEYLTQDEINFVEESLTSPNVFVQDGDQVFPCIVEPKTETVPSKENNDLRRLTLTIRVNGTQYSQRN